MRALRIPEIFVVIPRSVVRTRRRVKRAGRRDNVTVEITISRPRSDGI